MSHVYAIAMADLLAKHILPLSGGSTVLVGLKAQTIADRLSSDFSNLCFTIELDPLNFLVEPAAGDRLSSCDLICFFDAFTENTILHREQVLSKARDSLACRVLHFESETTVDNQWRLTDSLSMGYRRIDCGKFEQTEWSLYEFNIANYKNTPGWLNADH